MDDVRNDAEGGAGLMNKMRDGATAQLGAQKDRATDSIGSVAQAVRQSTQHLRDNHHDTIAQYVEQAADQLERFSSKIRDKDINELFRDAQQFARRNPAVFIGSAFALGLLGARFLKSSGGRPAEPQRRWNNPASFGAAQGYAVGTSGRTDSGPRFGDTAAVVPTNDTERF